MSPRHVRGADGLGGEAHTLLGKMSSEALGEDLRKMVGSLDRTRSAAVLAAALAVGALSSARAQVMARTGTNFNAVGIAWQYRWGAGL
jgi:hypothetical protein